jgi:D-lyxose ketol-isomerase
MITREEHNRIRDEALEYFARAGLVLSPAEAERIEVADFGLSRPREIGLELVVYVNTDRYCAKDLVLLPRQLCPEHRHPPVGSSPGKQETFRCRWGTVHLYVPGTKVETACARPPAGYEKHLTVWHEITLMPGEQATIPPDTLHWFQAGDEGAIVSEFSSSSSDEEDLFTDPEIERTTRVVG